MRGPSGPDADDARPRDVALGCARFGAFGSDRRGGGFSLRSSGFFDAHRFDADRFDASCFSRHGFLFRRVRRSCFGRRGRYRSLLFGGCLDVRGLSATAYWFTRHRRRCRLGDWLRNGHRSTSASGGHWNGLLLGTRPLLTFPTRADASDLVVGEHTHVAANGNVHLPEKGDNLFGRHCEFVRQLTD